MSPRSRASAILLALWTALAAPAGIAHSEAAGVEHGEGSHAEALHGEVAPAVAALRQRQTRLKQLEFALKEAQLLRELCELNPSSPECGALLGTAAEAIAADESALDAPALPLLRLVEVFGSHDRLRAVLAGADGGARTVSAGSRLFPDITVERITPASAVLAVGDDRFVLMLEE